MEEGRSCFVFTAPGNLQDGKDGNVPLSADKTCTHKAIPLGTDLPETSPLEDRLLTDHMVKKAFSLTYSKIINNQTDPTKTLRERWQIDLEDSDWQEALSSPREVAIPSRIKLIQLKILHRTYYTRTTLYKMGKIDTPLCLRQCGIPGTFYHTLWDCPAIKSY